MTKSATNRMVLKRNHVDLNDKFQTYKPFPGIAIARLMCVEAWIQSLRPIDIQSRHFLK